MYGAYEAKAADFDGDEDLGRVKGIRMWCWGQGMCQQAFRVRPCLIDSFVSVHALWCSRTIGRWKVNESGGPHRLALQADELTATVVDNHHGLSGQQQIGRRARVPSADGHGALYCKVPFEDRFNGYTSMATMVWLACSTKAPAILSCPARRDTIANSSSIGAMLHLSRVGPIRSAAWRCPRR